MADLTHDTADDAFHEIQLSGKQLVFLFMATTVISVIIFICGVLVGRRVVAQEIGRENRPLVASDTAPSDPEPAPPATGPAPASETSGYQARLESPRTQPEPLKPPAADPVASPVPEPPAEAPSAAAALPKPEKTQPPALRPDDQQPLLTGGARPGVWAVQVMSLRDRSAAMQLVQRLKGKGYPAYIVPPAPGAAAQLYKVQVGRYRNYAEAQQVDAKLKKEEQFKTWIVR